MRGTSHLTISYTTGWDSTPLEVVGAPETLLGSKNPTANLRRNTRLTHAKHYTWLGYNSIRETVKCNPK